MLKFEHIGIAVKNIEKGIKIWEGIFGLKNVGAIYELPLQMVKVALLDAGGVKIELLEPIGEESPIAKFLKKRGEGLHHICFEVRDIETILSALKKKEVKLIDESPRQGAFSRKVVFLHPSSSQGVLVELCEK